ncbi:MAG: hypothetical protein ACLSAC_03830 [Enterocloster bolteae]
MKTIIILGSHYIPGIVKCGKDYTWLLGIFAGFLPALGDGLLRGYIASGVRHYRAVFAPDADQRARAFTLTSVGAHQSSSPPILGIPGTYLTFLSGNTSNMRVPCSSVAQEAAGVEMGTEEGSIISTIGIANVRSPVNVVILTVGAAGGFCSLLHPNILLLHLREGSQRLISCFPRSSALYPDSLPQPVPNWAVWWQPSSPSA